MIRIAGPTVRTLACFTALVATPALADTTIEESLRIEGAGMMSMANMSGRTVTMVSGDRARMSSELQMESRLMRTFAGSGETVEIVRLDQDKTYSLDMKRKRYTELSLAEQRQQMQSAMAQMRESQESQRQGTSGVDESECQWSEARAEVEQGVETATIAGHHAERTTIRATQSCTNPKTNEVCDFQIVLDQWLAPDAAPAAELQKFYAAYMQQMGLTAEGSPDFVQRAESLFGMYPELWGEVAATLKESNGLPVRTSVSMAIGGAQCASRPDTQEATAPGVGEAIGGALGGAIGGFLGRRRDAAARDQAKAEAAAKPQADTADGMLKLMTVTSELISVSEASIPADRFEVPAGFKRDAG